MAIDKEKASLCALGRIFHFDPKIALALISHFGNASAIFDAGTETIDDILGPFSRYKGKIAPEETDKAYNELLRLHQRGVTFTGWTEKEYPSLLKECEDAPVGLYIRSSTPTEALWKHDKNISVIGTRDISSYGTEWCRKIVEGLGACASRTTVTSGLALGTDICAHLAALEAGIPTIGVMATGPDMVYPHRHEHIAERIAETQGCALITEFPPGTAPLAAHFLRRNRIIAGLSHAVILIESKIRGGGMNTSRLAFSYNREVYALPGRADDIRSQGCNSLIREKVAEPVTSVEDLIRSLGMKKVRHTSARNSASVLEGMYSSSMDSDRISMMSRIISTLRENKESYIEDIAEKTGLPYRQTASLCRILENDGIIYADLLQRYSINTKNF